jgi:CRISPR/Cas system-associated exonuclease Cas4 (RecB family)
MKDFLAYVAEDIIQKYGTNLSHIAVVFPNKRASLFLNEHLAHIANQPIWSPAYITISELFRQQSSLQVADPIKLVCNLHKSFSHQTGSTETLDKFYGWGQLLLTDFDDIDKNLADPDCVFANLRDIHELDDISYLTDEQREIISRFFSNFSENQNTELKERFLRLWSHFADIYHDFNERLVAQGLAYEGALYRQVCNNTVKANGTQNFSYFRYLFVGFNLLQKVEQQLFHALKKEGKACFYWDFDNYYINQHEAGENIKRFLHIFPNELDTKSNVIYDNFRRSKHISFISAPTENIQARYVSNWLLEKERYKDGRHTAIVMCNENLLPVVIHCIPDKVDKVNVTTGYPLSKTPIASFIELWFNVMLRGPIPRILRTFQRHPYAKFIDNKETWFEKQELTHLLRLLRHIAQNSKENINDSLFQESLFRAYTLINRLEDLRKNGDLNVDTITLQRLISQLMQQATIPFHGEPVEGLQVMGVLETRNLDFDHVLLLSCNEGNMPRGVNDSSFIPHNIRRAYELTTIEHKVSIYSYYFHRLLQRASDITILYNNSTEDGQRGEMSRFMLQLMVDYEPYPCNQKEKVGSIIKHYTLQSGQTTIRWQPKPIHKTSQVMDIINTQWSAENEKCLSPSAINKYMRCPLQFYYNYVADIKEPELNDDEQVLDNRIFGNIFHEAADIIYRQLPKDINKAMLDHLLKTNVEIEKAVDKAFYKEMPNIPVSGLQLINREVIIHYLRQLINIDRRLAPFTILGLEYDVQRSLSFVLSNNMPLNIGGRIDRLDLLSDGTIRVVDYKTGSRRLKPLPDVDAIFKPENISEHSDYYLQIFTYADIVDRQKHNLPHTSGFLPLRVSPALLFIQHAGAENYDPTLCFGHEPIRDITDYTNRFNELLETKIREIFSSDHPFAPTQNLRICRTCPYAPFCRSI